MTELPIPPSANRLWRVFGGRVVKSRYYAEWLDHVVWILRRDMKPVSVPCKVEILLVGGRGTTIRSDLDNKIKPTLDALRDAGIIPDDSVQFVTQIEARYTPRESKKAQASFHVRVTPA